jgi:hypothetical protein
MYCRLHYINIVGYATKKMKKFFTIAILLLGVKGIANGQTIENKIDNFLKIGPNVPQEIIVLGTNKSQDGYISGGFMVGRNGLYAGVPYNDKQILNRNNGTVSRDMRFGILRQIQPNRLILGVGAQPTDEGTKLNSFIGFNPLRSKDMKLWLIGNVTGSTFSFGLGLSYKVK